MYLYYCMLPHVWRICYFASIAYSPNGRTYYRSGPPWLHPVHLYMVWFTLSNVDDVEIFFFIIPYWSIIVDLNNWVRPMFISLRIMDFILEARIMSPSLHMKDTCWFSLMLFLISQLWASCPVCSSSLSGVRLVRWSLYQDTNCAEVESRVVWHVALKPNMFLQLIF